MVVTWIGGGNTVDVQNDMGLAACSQTLMPMVSTVKADWAWDLLLLYHCRQS